MRRRELTVALRLPLREGQQLGLGQPAVADGPQDPVGAATQQVLQLQLAARTGRWRALNPAWCALVVTERSGFMPACSRQKTR